MNIHKEFRVFGHSIIVKIHKDIKFCVSVERTHLRDLIVLFLGGSRIFFPDSYNFSNLKTANHFRFLLGLDQVSESDIELDEIPF